MMSARRAENYKYSITHGSSVGLLTKSVPDHFHETSACDRQRLLSLFAGTVCRESTAGRPNEYCTMLSLTCSSSLASINCRVYTQVVTFLQGASETSAITRGTLLKQFRGVLHATTMHNYIHTHMHEPFLRLIVVGWLVG